MKIQPLLAIALALTACASQDPTTRVSDAATAPLSDLNLVHAKIPEILQEAQRHPYLAPIEPSCATLSAAVAALDQALGPDLDAPPSAAPGLIERGGTAVGDAAVGAIRSTAEGVVPFRSWVRKLTGAERYSKEVAAAIAAGTVRRAFLKGIGVARNCSS